jgi:polyisoprenoid-binding protein YceI
MNRLVSLPAVVLVLAGSIAWGQDDSRAEFKIYRVDAEGSDIRLLVHRAGVLSRLGHSHVISVGQIAGTVYVHPDLERSSFELEIPVRGLVVDDPRLRREEGDEFSTEPSERDIAGTRANMLGERVLNAEQYPLIKLTGTGSTSDGSEFVLDVSIELLGRVVELAVPTTLRLDADSLEATGTFRLSHGDLGMRPFSAMVGALRVADEMELKYRVRALPLR